MDIIYWKRNKQEIPPVVRFIRAVPAKAQAKILKGIDFLEKDGTALLAIQNKLFRKMSPHDFYELRILFDKNLLSPIRCLTSS